MDALWTNFSTLVSFTLMGIWANPLNFVWQGAIFILPAAFANMAPIVANKVPGASRFSAPVWEWGLGRNKTYRGLVAGYLAALLLVLLYGFLQQQGLLTGTYINYAGTNAFLLAFVFAGGALGGDMVKSFFKRHVAHIPPGKPWDPWDRVDFVLGTIVLSLTCVNWQAEPPQLTRFGFTLLGLALIVPICQWAVNTIAYNLHIKETP